ncbi:MAG: GHKL domain-containing protein [Butyrivibrio sp.]|nr:GHKL domain-containing protein [Butyrivibrio sp.]
MMTYNVFFQYESIGYFIEVIIAELLFFKALQKREKFYMRFILSVLFSLFLVSQLGLSSWTTTLSRFVMLLVILAISYFCMFISYKETPFSIFSACIAGIATQHIANKVLGLLELIPAVDFFSKESIIKDLILEIAVSFAIYLIIYLLFARNFRPDTGSIESTILSVILVLTCIGINRLVIDHSEANIYYKAASCLYAIICCVFAMTIQFFFSKWQQEKADSLVIKQLLSASEKQYEQWKAMVQLNNIHTHDLKHMLNNIEKLAGKDAIEIPDLSPIRNSLDEFAPLVKTGNEVIDVLLRNMDTLCKEQDIHFNCVSYTEMLGKFDSMSLYFLFANAIDNARAGAGAVTVPDKRMVDVSLKQFGDSVIIHVWNYFNGELTIKDGLPVSSNTSSGHGFGLKSIKMLVDKFEGAMEARPEGDVFHLNIILPLKKDSK